MYMYMLYTYTLLSINVIQAHAEGVCRLFFPILTQGFHLGGAGRIENLLPPIWAGLGFYSDVVQSCGDHISLQQNMCQSRVEIEYYSVAYFDRITVFKALYLRTSVKGGTQMRCKIASIVAAFT